jgi:ferredoxin
MLKSEGVWAMCDFCKRFGEGLKWYLNPENYSKEMLKSGRVQRDMMDVIGFEGSMVDILSGPSRQSFEEGLAAMVDTAVPDVRDKESVQSLSLILEGSHGGQVIPLEDAKKIVDLAMGPIMVQECYCRKYFGDESKFSCMWLYPVSEEAETKRPWEEHRKLSKEQAKKLLQELGGEGCYHAIYWAPVPYPIVICNCDPLFCISYKGRMAYGVQKAVLKGEYAAVVDHRKCDGCGEDAPRCLTRCHFGAMRFSPLAKKAFADIQRCFGCGLCRGACHTGAIKLVDRTSIPTVREVW